MEKNVNNFTPEGKFTGGEPNVGTFDVTFIRETHEAYINICKVDGEHIECSVDYLNGINETYAKLREHGFTIAGFKTATVIPFKRT